MTDVTIVAEPNNGRGKYFQGLPEGYVLYDYRIVQVLGIGSFGITYKAIHEETDEPVVIKEYFPRDWAKRDDKDDVTVVSNTVGNTPMLDNVSFYQWGRDRFLREAKILRKIKHDGVVTVLHFFSKNGTAYFVMEFEEGDPLKDYLGDDKILSQEEIYKHLGQILSALTAIHKKDIIHRDLKPDNIIVRSRDEKMMLIDFGASGQTDADGTKTLIGSPNYAAPEQFNSGEKQGPWTDIYAVGAILYRCISGADPMDAEDRKKGVHPFVSAGQIGAGRYDTELLNLIDKSMELDPKKRFQSVADVWKALPKGTVEGRGRKKRWLVTLAATLAVLAIGGYVVHKYYINPPMALLAFKTLPVDATVEILNRQREYFAGVALEPGNYHIQISHPQYETQKKWYKLVAGDNNWNVELEPKWTPPSENPSEGSSIYPKMVYIKGGYFRMGSSESEEHRFEDEQQLEEEVHVNEFYISKHEITKKQYEAFVNEEEYKTWSESEDWGCASSTSIGLPSKRLGKSWRGPGYSQSASHPVVCVTWHDVMAYLAWLSEETGEVYRLPTEAEWEYAVRANTRDSYYWAEKPGEHCDYANSRDGVSECDDKYQYTAPVGSFKANDYGLHDMSGNVSEWTCSRYKPKYDGSEEACNTNIKSTDKMVVRGGSWFDPLPWLRSAKRFKIPINMPISSVGFRVVKSGSDDNPLIIIQ